MIPVDPRDFAADAFAKIKPCCGECGSRDNVDIAPATIVYPNRADLWAHEDGGERWFWLCSSCWAYVGVHRASLKPLGSPAGKETRLARADAHAAFDPLWRKRMALSGISQTKARNRGYKWLAEQLGIENPKHCHIGWMDAATARRVVEICRGARARK
jgi:hypothetical protein